MACTACDGGRKNFAGDSEHEHEEVSEGGKQCGVGKVLLEREGAQAVLEGPPDDACSAQRSTSTATSKNFCRTGDWNGSRNALGIRGGGSG